MGIAYYMDLPSIGSMAIALFLGNLFVVGHYFKKTTAIQTKLTKVNASLYSIHDAIQHILQQKGFPTISQEEEPDKNVGFIPPWQEVVVSNTGITQPSSVTRVLLPFMGPITIWIMTERVGRAMALTLKLWVQEPGQNMGAILP